MDESNSEEASLWRAASEKGDSAAFSVLFDRHKDRVFRHAFHHLQHTTDAEDATATAFMELWRGRRKVELVDGTVLPWLLGITTNTARNLARSRRRYSHMLDRLPRGVDAPQDPAEIAITRIESVDAMHSVAAILKGLSAADAALVSLTAFEGFSTETAAAVVGISPGAARTRLYRLRRRLRLQSSTTEVTP